MLRPLNMLALLACLLAAGTVLHAEDPPKPEGEDAPKAAAEDAADKDEDGKDQDDDEKKEEDRYLAITADVVHTVTRGDLYGVTILTKNGKIIDIGAEVEIPEEAEILDASGHHVYPGLIAVNSAGLLGSNPIEDTTNVFSLSMTLALAGGITTAVSGNTAGKLTYGTLEDMVIKRDLFHNLSYDTARPDARRKLRAKFDKIRQYLRDLEKHREDKKKDPEAKPPDKEWLKGEYQKLMKLMKGEITAVASANSANDIVQYCELSDEYGFSMVLRGGMEAWTVAPRLARSDVATIISIRAGMFSSGSGSDDRLNRPTGRSIENAAILHRHGVPLAILPMSNSISLWGLAGRDLLHLNMEAAFAVRGGLPESAALRSITIDAARILGIDHRVGSIAVGKDADFAITDGDMLHYMTHTRWTVVNGRIAYDKLEDTLFDHIRPDGDLDAPAPDDYWPRRLGAGQ